MGAKVLAIGRITGDQGATYIFEVAGGGKDSVNPGPAKRLMRSTLSMVRDPYLFSYTHLPLCLSLSVFNPFPLTSPTQQ